MKDLLVEDRTSQALLTHKIILKNDAREVIICKDTFTASRASFGRYVVFLDKDLPH